jgi:hypothetical protein
MAKQKVPQSKSKNTVVTKPSNSLVSKYLKSNPNAEKIEIPFRKRNYQLMVLGFVVILIGYALMWGTEDIYDFRKRTLSVLVIMAGFTLEVFAIMHRDKSFKESLTEDNQNASQE